MAEDLLADQSLLDESFSEGFGGGVDGSAFDPEQVEVLRRPIDDPLSEECAAAGEGEPR